MMAKLFAEVYREITEKFFNPKKGVKAYIHNINTVELLNVLYIHFLLIKLYFK